MVEGGGSQGRRQNRFFLFRRRRRDASKCAQGNNQRNDPRNLERFAHGREHQLENKRGGGSAIRRHWLYERNLRSDHDRPDRHTGQRSRQISRGLEKAGRWDVEVRDGYVEFRSSCGFVCSSREKVGAVEAVVSAATDE